MRERILAIVLLFAAGTTFGQSSKTIRTYGITKKTETVIKYDDTKEIARYVEEIEHYNKEGDWVEKFTYSSGGELKLHEIRVYEKDEVVDETVIDINGSNMKAAEPPSYERMLYTYDKGDLMLEKEVDRDGNVLKVKEYEYNKLGDLIEVKTKDGKDRIVERETTEYDNRGLKMKESVFDESGKLIEEKIFVYE